MMNFKTFILKEKKDKVYSFYERVATKPKEYDKVSRNEIYHHILFLYQEDPELILRMCSLEEINILKSMLIKNLPKHNNGYIEYLLIKNLKDNYLILEENEEYYIPEDLLNYVKMAINLFDEKAYSLRDVTDSVMMGIVRIYHVLDLEAFFQTLEKYYVKIKLCDLKKYIARSPKLKKVMKILKYQKKEYIVSTEWDGYKEVLQLRKCNVKEKDYDLEEVLSIGKYKINLFEEVILNFLNFLEMHLDSKYIDEIVNELIIYCGYDMNDEKVLLNIADHIDELYQALKKVVPYMPVWIYQGNDLNSFKDNLILPDKNGPCICGSGKKFKHCCMKYLKK